MGSDTTLLLDFEAQFSDPRNKTFRDELIATWRARIAEFERAMSTGGGRPEFAQWQASIALMQACIGILQNTPSQPHKPS